MTEESLEDVDYHVALPDFEGPLDLLLHLVKKHELSIIDIPIAFITDQYLRMLDMMRALNLDIAGEYLLMAATLAHLKSRELVPPDPADVEAVDEAGDEDLDPRQELIRRLLEYQKYKEAAHQLGGRPVVGRNVWLRGSSAEDVAGIRVLNGGAPLAEIPVFHLIESLERVLSRAKVTFAHDVMPDRVSITDKIQELTERLAREEAFTFESCFEAALAGESILQVRSQVVVTFLAILEMTRLKMMRLSQTDRQSTIYISRAANEANINAQDLTARDDEYKG